MKIRFFNALGFSNIAILRYVLVGEFWELLHLKTAKFENITLGKHWHDNLIYFHL